MKKTNLLVGAIISGLIAGAAVNPSVALAEGKKGDGKEQACKGGSCKGHKKKGDKDKKAGKKDEKKDAAAPADGAAPAEPAAPPSGE